MAWWSQGWEWEEWGWRPSLAEREGSWSCWNDDEAPLGERGAWSWQREEERRWWEQEEREEERRRWDWEEEGRGRWVWEEEKEEEPSLDKRGGSSSAVELKPRLNKKKRPAGSGTVTEISRKMFQLRGQKRDEYMQKYNMSAEEALALVKREEQEEREKKKKEKSEKKEEKKEGEKKEGEKKEEELEEAADVKMKPEAASSSSSEPNWDRSSSRSSPNSLVESELKRRATMPEQELLGQRSSSSKQGFLDERGKQPETGSLADLRPKSAAEQKLEELREQIKAVKLETASCASRTTVGAQSRASTTKSLDKREQLWVQKNPPNLGKRLGVDWHWTVQIDSYETGVKRSIVPGTHVAALKALKASGFSVFLLSYCFKNREREVREAVQSLKTEHDYEFDGLCFVRSPTGTGGKAEACTRLRLSCLFEDREDICRDALAKGISVFPVRSPINDHKWASESYVSFDWAVEAFLIKEAKKKPEEATDS